MHLFLVATRYLLARPVSFVAILVFIVAVVALVLVDSIMNGFLREHRSMARGTSPDVAVSLDKALRRDESALQKVLETVRETEGVTAAGLRRTWPVLYRREGSTRSMSDRESTDHFVHLLGMDLGAGGELDELRAMVDAPVRPAYVEMIEASRRPSLFSLDSSKARPSHEVLLRPPRPEDPLWFDKEDEFWRDRISDRDFLDYPLNPILFGEQLSFHKALFVGQVIKVIGLGDPTKVLGPEGEPTEEDYYPKRAKYYVVVGSFRSEDQLFEDTHAIMARDRVLEFCGTAEFAEEVSISVVSVDEDEAVRARLVARLGALELGPDMAVGEEDIQTWEERQKVLLNAVENERVIMNFVLLIVVGIAGFSLLVTLSMMVNTKIREVGVLISMGATARDIVAVFLLCGLMVSLVGISLGLALGLWLCNSVNRLLAFFDFELFDKQFYSFGELPTEIDAGRLVSLVTATLVTGVVASVVPSVRAGRLEAVEALRQG